MPDVIQAVLREIEGRGRPLLIAIDGRCAAGKTCLAARLKRACDCYVIPMDHFFLRPEQRTAERLSEPGGNVDYERFLSEVLLPLKQMRPFTYTPYDCRAQAMGGAIRIEPRPVNIIEGSYSCHPALFEYYDLSIFLSVGKAEQLRRIRLRNGEAAIKFQNTWIPLEERYFNALGIKERCSLRFTSEPEC